MVIIALLFVNVAFSQDGVLGTQVSDLGIRQFGRML